MTAKKLLENACALIGTAIEDARIASVMFCALNMVYAEMCFNYSKKYTEITALKDVLDAEEVIFYDVMPYGVASLIAGAIGDTENQNYLGRMYNLKRKRHKASYVQDDFPNV